MVYALELDQGVYQEGQACVEFWRMYKICIELHPNKHIKDIGMHRYVIPNIVQHGVEACTKNY